MPLNEDPYIPSWCKYCWRTDTISKHWRSHDGKQRRFCARCQKTWTHGGRHEFSYQDKCSAVSLARVTSLRRAAKVAKVSPTTIKKWKDEMEMEKKRINNMYGGWLHLT
jgi:transposase-like protein